MPSLPRIFGNVYSWFTKEPADWRVRRWRHPSKGLQYYIDKGGPRPFVLEDPPGSWTGVLEDQGEPRWSDGTYKGRYAATSRYSSVQSYGAGGRPGSNDVYVDEFCSYQEAHRWVPHFAASTIAGT